jgi:hypothetical protein
MMAKAIYLLPLLILCFPGTQPDHAFYLSVTEVNLEKQGEVSVKVFSDDLQNALRNYSSQYRAANLKTYYEKNKELALAYFQEHLRFEADGKIMTLKYLSHSIEQDAHFISFRMDLQEKTTRLKVKAAFLMELFPTQINVLKLRKGEQLYFLKFTSREPQELNLLH